MSLVYGHMSKGNPNQTSRSSPLGFRSLLDEKALAERLAIAPQTLRAWRCRGAAGGPPFIRLGKAVRYDPAAIEKWLAAQTISRAS